MCLYCATRSIFNSEDFSDESHKIVKSFIAWIRSIDHTHRSPPGFFDLWFFFSVLCEAHRFGIVWLLVCLWNDDSNSAEGRKTRSFTFFLFSFLLRIFHDIINHVWLRDRIDAWLSSWLVTKTEREKQKSQKAEQHTKEEHNFFGVKSEELRKGRVGPFSTNSSIENLLLIEALLFHHIQPGAFLRNIIELSWNCCVFIRWIYT